MRLPRPFYRLPLRFDAARMQEEAAALPPSAWVSHPNDIAGNTAARLITVAGGENDSVHGPMLPTPHLERSPYLWQVLASFGVVWSRSRLLKLAPRATVPQHADINHHWFTRVRLHIPVRTRPEVRFYCDSDSVHMAAGEAWVFDNWRLHRVENPTDEERIHLVADTSGNSEFWHLIGASGAQELPVRDLVYDPHAARADLYTEQALARPVMTPGEMDLLILDLRAELTGQNEAGDVRERLSRYHGLLDSFARDWRQLYARWGEESRGLPAYRALLERLRSASRAVSDGLVMRTNRVAAHLIVEGRVLRAALAPEDSRPANPPPAAAVGSPPGQARTARAAASPATGPLLERPVFIVAAPRSGSTLLFETLGASQALATLGGEAHWLVEAHELLRPGAPGVDSNRLTGEHATTAIAAAIEASLKSRLQDSEGRPVTSGVVRLLEKTPKNALRVPFFARLYPDALFLFLWREPRESLGSIIDAWRSGEWRTYPQLRGFELPWSLLLPPGWQALRGRPLGEIASLQWETTNRVALDDLEKLAPERWMSLSYDGLVAEPRAMIERACRFIGVDFDEGLARRLAAPLRAAQYTHSAPDPDKWRRHAALIEPVVAALTPTWERLRALDH